MSREKIDELEILDSIENYLNAYVYDVELVDNSHYEGLRNTSKESIYGWIPFIVNCNNLL